MNKQKNCNILFSNNLNLKNLDYKMTLFELRFEPVDQPLFLISWTYWDFQLRKFASSPIYFNWRQCRQWRRKNDYWRHKHVRQLASVSIDWRQMTSFDVQWHQLTSIDAWRYYYYRTPIESHKIYVQKERRNPNTTKNKHHFLSRTQQEGER